MIFCRLLLPYVNSVGEKKERKNKITRQCHHLGSCDKVEFPVCPNRKEKECALCLSRDRTAMVENTLCSGGSCLHCKSHGQHELGSFCDESRH